MFKKTAFVLAAVLSATLVLITLPAVSFAQFGTSPTDLSVGWENEEEGIVGYEGAALEVMVDNSNEDPEPIAKVNIVLPSGFEITEAELEGWTPEFIAENIVELTADEENGNFEDANDSQSNYIGNEAATFVLTVNNPTEASMVYEAEVTAYDKEGGEIATMDTLFILQGGEAVAFEIELPENVTAEGWKAGEEKEIMFTAVDQYGNKGTYIDDPDKYVKSLHFSGLSVSPGGFEPTAECRIEEEPTSFSSATPASFDGPESGASVIPYCAEEDVAITVEDRNAGIEGTSAAFDVLAAADERFDIEGPGEADVGTGEEYAVYVLDEYWNVSEAVQDYLEIPVEVEAANDENTGQVDPEKVDVLKGETEASFTWTPEEAGEFTITADRYSTILQGVSLDVTAKEEDKKIPPETGVTMFIGETAYWVDGEEKEMDFAPFIENGRTFVPLRFVAEEFGLYADWGPKDSLTEWVKLFGEDVEIYITIGEKEITVIEIVGIEGDKERIVTSDVPAQIKNGRTVLPLRAVGEILGAKFDWGPREDVTEWVNFS